MTFSTYEQELLEYVRSLPKDKQRTVLEFAQSLAAPAGVPGETLLRFAGTIPADDLAVIETALEDLEKVDPSEY